jgi:caa(3)-type oxidase subunit IV
MNHEHEEHVHDGHAVGHEDSHGIKPYLLVFGALAVFTAISFVVYESLPKQTLAPFVIILSIAIAKAILVAMYFMHLVLDWKRVYILIVPALILGPILVIVLLPDIVLAWRTAP